MEKEFYCTLRINDMDGKLIEKKGAIFCCDDCETVKAFGEKYAESVQEFLSNQLATNIDEENYIFSLNIVLLHDTQDYDVCPDAFYVNDDDEQ